MKSVLLEKSKKHLRAQGGRMTAQRRLIVETLSSLDTHPTAEEVYRIAREKDSTLHLSTVYRTLRWLEQEGLIASRLFDDERRQERFDATDLNEHYHFMCNSCKKVIEFDTLLVNTIKAQFELHSGAQVESGSVVLYGTCADCRKQIFAAEQPD